jgi:hypothetical protein
LYTDEVEIEQAAAREENQDQRNEEDLVTERSQSAYNEQTERGYIREKASADHSSFDFWRCCRTTMSRTARRRQRSARHAYERTHHLQ